MFFIGEHSIKKLKKQSRTKSYLNKYIKQPKQESNQEEYQKNLKKENRNKNVIFYSKFMCLIDKNKKEDKIIVTQQQIDLQQIKQKVLLSRKNSDQVNNISSIKITNNNLLNDFKSTKNLNQNPSSTLEQIYKTNSTQNKKTRFYTSRHPKRLKTFKSFVCQMNIQLKENYDQKNLQKFVKFNNSIIASSFSRKKKISHSAKVSKCLTLGQSDLLEVQPLRCYQESGIIITGLKAPQIQTIDHLKLRTKTSNRKQVKFNNQKISKQITNTTNKVNQNEVISKIF